MSAKGSAGRSADAAENRRLVSCKSQSQPYGKAGAAHRLALLQQTRSTRSDAEGPYCADTSCAGALLPDLLTRRKRTRGAAELTVSPPG
jgi:hypothetical protein